MIDTIPKTNDAVHSPFAVDVQNTVGRLLAKENIKIHRSATYRTAFFNMETRTVGLPVMLDAPRAVYDLFIGHEVGHALWSSIEDFNALKSNPKYRRFHSVFNILEDIRIEKKIMRSYPGLIKDFRAGYKYLFDIDFFGKNVKDQIALDSMNVLDRLNVLAKCGTGIINPNFKPEEKSLVDDAFSVETAEDVERVANRIIDNFMSKEAEPEVSAMPEIKVDISDTEADRSDCEDVGGFGGEEDEPSTDEEPEKSEDNVIPTKSGDETEDSDNDNNIPTKSGDETEDSDSAKTEDSDNDESSNPDDANAKSTQGDDNGKSNPDAAPDGDGTNVDNEPEEEFVSETEEAFNEALSEKSQEIGQTDFALDCEFIEPSREALDYVVTPWAKAIAARNADSWYNSHILSMGNKPDIINRWNVFTKDSKKLASQLANEFERKKAAFQYTRAGESRRGVINVNSLHRYKTDDNIFKTIMQLADAKNHGMIFLVDFSGSMSSCIGAVIEKTIILTDFCRITGIPFSVYTFTSVRDEVRPGNTKKPELQTHELSLLNLHLIEVLSSSMPKSIYLRAKKDLYLGLIEFPCKVISSFEHMGSTPLNEALVAVTYILKEFIAKTNVQVSNLIVLSDGSGSRCKIVNYDVYTPWDKRNVETAAYGRIAGGKVKLTNGVGKTRTNTHVHNVHHHALLKNIKALYGTNTLCFYISNSQRSLKNTIGCMNESYDLTRRPYSYEYGQEDLKMLENISETKIDINNAMRELRKVGIAAYENIIGYDQYIYVLTANSGNISSFGDIECEEENIKEITQTFMRFGKSHKSKKLFCSIFASAVCGQF